jgi:hypothetical protein
MNIYSLARPLLFALDAEHAHELTLRGVALADKLGLFRPTASAQADSLQVMGLQFPNRVGLAAGLDKNAIAVDGSAGLASVLSRWARSRRARSPETLRHACSACLTSRPSSTAWASTMRVSMPY